jgi:hypothetical protein
MTLKIQNFWLKHVAYNLRCSKKTTGQRAPSHLTHHHHHHLQHTQFFYTTPSTPNLPLCQHCIGTFIR